LEKIQKKSAFDSRHSFIIHQYSKINGGAGFGIKSVQISIPL